MIIGESLTLSILISLSLLHTNTPTLLYFIQIFVESVSFDNYMFS